jgi:3'-phosphoadenosine 5'-phosphosulfate (PAPS) 3'-phosphatase
MLAIIIDELTKAFPDDPIIGEEDAKALRADNDAARQLKTNVVALTQTVVPELDEQVCVFKTMFVLFLIL